jgi:hypothetical protein
VFPEEADDLKDLPLADQLKRSWQKHEKEVKSPSR